MFYWLFCAFAWEAEGCSSPAPKEEPFNRVKTKKEDAENRHPRRATGPLITKKNKTFFLVALIRRRRSSSFNLYYLFIIYIKGWDKMTYLVGQNVLLHGTRWLSREPLKSSFV